MLDVECGREYLRYAAGIVPAAHASDGGGSIRIPAGMCGVVGLKPTRGRNSFGPGLGERWNGFSAEFAVTRSVRDAAALLDVTAGPMPGDPYSAAPPALPFAYAPVAPPPHLRIGVMRRCQADRNEPGNDNCRQEPAPRLRVSSSLVCLLRTRRGTQSIVRSSSSIAPRMRGTQ